VRFGSSLIFDAHHLRNLDSDLALALGLSARGLLRANLILFYELAGLVKSVDEVDWDEREGGLKVERQLKVG